MNAFLVPTYHVEFEPIHDMRITVSWVVWGDDELDAVCKALRRNGITTYMVKTESDREMPDPPVVLKPDKIR